MTDFQHDWTSDRLPLWKPHVEHLVGRAHVHALEIGAFEGRSTAWMLEHVLTHPTSAIVCLDPFRPNPTFGFDGDYLPRFVENTAPYRARVRLLQAFSREVSARALLELAPGYDLVYVDGSHEPVDVVRDAALALAVARPGAVIAFDDYAWAEVGAAVDRWLQDPGVQPRLAVLQRGYQLLARVRTQAQPAPVAVTLFRRPEYTRRVLSALGECYGVDDRDIYLSLDWDPGHAQAIEAVRELALEFCARHRRARVIAHSEKLGIDVHKEWLVRHVLADGADRFVFVEDDTVPARDALHYFDWALEAFRLDASVVSVGGYRKTDALDAAALGEYERLRTFVPWGWAMWADRWNQYWGDGSAYRRDLARWFGEGESPNGRFDYWWMKLCEDAMLWSVFPAVSRMFNCGRDDGEHTHPEVFEQTDYNPVGAWQIEALPDRAEWVPRPAGERPQLHVIGEISRARKGG